MPGIQQTRGRRALQQRTLRGRPPHPQGLAQNLAAPGGRRSTLLRVLGAACTASTPRTQPAHLCGSQAWGLQQIFRKRAKGDDRGSVLALDHTKLLADQCGDPLSASMVRNQDVLMLQDPIQALQQCVSCAVVPEGLADGLQVEALLCEALRVPADLPWVQRGTPAVVGG